MHWSTLLVLLSAAPSFAAAGSDNCLSSSGYQCPYLSDYCNETVSVSDCFGDCEGYRNTDKSLDVCFDRKLLSPDNPDPSLFWRDIIGIVVWFCAAGVAVSCGVGGGGLYVSQMRLTQLATFLMFTRNQLTSLFSGYTRCPWESCCCILHRKKVVV
jgi:hypothetical protein